MYSQPSPPHSAIDVGLEQGLPFGPTYCADQVIGKDLWVPSQVNDFPPSVTSMLHSMILASITRFAPPPLPDPPSLNSPV